MVHDKGEHAQNFSISSLDLMKWIESIVKI